jgi:hypothetical protein
MATISLTAAANSAAQFLGVLDSGESLSTQQVNDAFLVANRLLGNLYQEQLAGAQEWVTQKNKEIQALIDTQFSVLGGLFYAYSLALNAVTIATLTGHTVTPNATPQFADNTTALLLPLGFDRVMVLALAIELAPQYDMEPSMALLKQYTEARAAASPMPGHLPAPGQSAQSQGVPKGAE